MKLIFILVVNQQNCRYWALKNPRELHAKPLHNPNVTVWYAVGKSAVIVLYFLEENNGNAVTVNTEINNFFVPELQRKYVPIRHAWYQQDEATAHTARASMEVLRPIFGDRLISRFADTP